MNEQNVEGIKILSFKELPEKAVNAMASIRAADYEVSFREGMSPDCSCLDILKRMYGEPEILVLKKTKKSESMVDIKPGIYGIGGDENLITMCLSCGSALNIKPELVIKAACDRAGAHLNDYSLLIKRKEIYTENDGKRVSLDDIGSTIVL